MGTYILLVEYYRSYCDHKWGCIDGWLNTIEVIMVTSGTYRWLVEYYRSYCDHKWGRIDGWLNTIEVIVITSGDLYMAG